MTLEETLHKGRRTLRRGGISSPDLDAELLLADLLRIDRPRLLLRGKETLAENLAEAYRSRLERRLGGECTAYITGRREFWGLDFTVRPEVLVPQPDTETLVEAALEALRRNVPAKSGESLRVLDLCTGSGAIAIALKHDLPELEVWASDISEEALGVASLNAEKLLGSPGAVRFIHTDLFDAFPSGNHQSFSLIVSNPPYIPSRTIGGLAPEVRFQPRLALDGGPEGLDIIQRIILQAGGWLIPGGNLLLEADPRQMQTITGMMEVQGFRNRRLFRDLSGHERVIGGRKEHD